MNLEEKILGHLKHSKQGKFADILSACEMTMEQGRTLDKTLQRLRRAGKIAFNRNTRAWAIK